MKFDVNSSFQLSAPVAERAKRFGKETPKALAASAT